MDSYDNGNVIIPQKTYRSMAASSNRKKKFLVLAAIDEKGPVNVIATLSEDHDTACHQAEISFGWGTFAALNKNQAQKVYKNHNRHLQNW